MMFIKYFNRKTLKKRRTKEILFLSFNLIFKFLFPSTWGRIIISKLKTHHSFKIVASKERSQI